MERNEKFPVLSFGIPIFSKKMSGPPIERARHITGSSCQLVAMFALSMCLLQAGEEAQLLSLQHTVDESGGRIAAQFSTRPTVRQFWTERGICFVFPAAAYAPELRTPVTFPKGVIKGIRVWRAPNGSTMMALDGRTPGRFVVDSAFQNNEFIVQVQNSRNTVGRKTDSTRSLPLLKSVQALASTDKGTAIRIAFTSPPEFRQAWVNQSAIVVFKAGLENSKNSGDVAIKDPFVRNARIGLTRSRDTFLRLDVTRKDAVSIVAKRDGNAVVINLEPRQKIAEGAPGRKVLLAANIPAILPQRESVPAPIELVANVPSPRPPVLPAVSQEFAVRTEPAAPLQKPVTTTLPHNLLVLLKSEHLRLSLQSGIERIAVGDPGIISAEPIGSREVLLLGKQWGNSSLLVWFKDHTVAEYRVWVQRDMATLRTALKRLHPRIEFEAASDRDAIVLMGTVPDLSVSQAALRIAQSFMDAAGHEDGSASADVLTQDPAAAKNRQPGEPEKPLIRVAPKPARTTGTVINMLVLEELPDSLEQKLTSVIERLGGQEVKVRRLVKGDIPDNQLDVFVLEGAVRSQVELTRILLLAAQTVNGRTATQDDLQVIADESGALVNGGSGGAASGGNGGGSSGGGMGGAMGGMAGGIGGGGGRLFNQVGRNLARAKAIQVAGGRVISFIQVKDLPQVRVNIRLYEVNRNKLRSFSPNLGLLTSSPTQGSLAPPVGAVNLQGQQAQRTGGAGKNAVQSVLGFLGGALSSETQLSTSHFAIETALSYLEKAGVARSISSPSLTVLSGEMAQFQVGGQIPLPQAFIPAFANGAAGNNGVYSSVTFETFGVSVGVRPLVDENDTVTVDLIPQIVTPNADLTASIRNSTGTNQLTSAFSTRSLRTSARLRDGQSLLLGGLLSRDTNDSRNGMPGVQDVPGLGWLFKDFNKSDNAQELIVVVNPVVLRESVAKSGMWAYPPVTELVRTQNN